jgi:hypothetical protein
MSSEYRGQSQEYCCIRWPSFRGAPEGYTQGCATRLHMCAGSARARHVWSVLVRNSLGNMHITLRFRTHGGLRYDPREVGFPQWCRAPV